MRRKSRYIKSFKYKHKSRTKIESSSCDFQFKSLAIQKSEDISGGAVRSDGSTRLSRSQSERTGRDGQAHVRLERISARRRTSNYHYALVMVLIVTLVNRLPANLAFCPPRCLCNDQSLSANCTQVPSISIVPMTLNPLLKQLTLNQLPMFELSNSLSVYRQLEVLSLKSNQLHQIQYQNFNFKPAPASVLVGRLPVPSTVNSNQELNSHNELLAKQLKFTIDKGVSQGQSGSSSGSSSSAAGPSSDEIRFHLRELDLSDNKIGQLGSPDEEQQETDGQESELEINRRLKSSELERLAPFLTLAKLERLDLSGNRLARLHEHVLLGLVQLRRLDLSRNQIESIHRYAFVGLVALEELRLASNRLARHLHQLGLALCRAPMNELRQLDLSDNYKLSPGEPEVMLPNQMFMCAPRLGQLRLDGLQLRYIQVNAFDNLQQLESLNLSRNYLEQVPTDSISYSNSNLSQSLKELDLSDTLIEFVNGRSLSPLRNLERLHMSRMQRLVSFDLAALSFRLSYQSADGSAGGNHNIEKLIITSGEFKWAVKSLLPEHLFERVQMPAETINHLPAGHQLINDRLIELHLDHNPRLLSVRCSSEPGSNGSSNEQPEPLPKSRLKFPKLRLLDLKGAVELRELPLESMVDLDGLQDGLLVDLSFVSKLNCSSCQMGWLLEAARQQRALSSFRSANWTPVPFDRFSLTPSQPSRVMLAGSHSVGCLWPFAMPLDQLLDLETNYAPLFSHCSQFAPRPASDRGAMQRVTDASLSGGTVVAAPQPDRETGGLAEAEGGYRATTVSSLALALCLLLLGLVTRLAVNWRRRPSFKWQRSPSLVATSMSSPSSSQNHEQLSCAADCSSSSILSAGGAPGHNMRLYAERALVGPDKQVASELRIAAVHQQQRQQLANTQLIFGPERNNGNVGRSIEPERAGRRGNLFSRIVARWSGAGNGFWLQARRPPATRIRSATSGSAGGVSRAAHIAGNIVYGGRREALADQCQPTGKRSLFPFSMLSANGQAGYTSACSFIKPAYDGAGDVSAAADERSEPLVYANCQQQDASRPQLGGAELWMPGCQKSQLIIESTGAGERQHQRQQMLLKQLEAIGRGPARQLLSSSLSSTCRSQQDAAASLANNPRHQLLVRYSNGAELCSSADAGSPQLAGLVANSTRVPAGLVAAQLPPLPVTQQPSYLSFQPTSSQLAIASATCSAGQPLPDGHIYVTLDRPIKQENGRDEYALYERPQQQRPGLFEEPAAGRSAADYKSFEWSSKPANVEPLKTVDKFKLDHPFGEPEQQREQFARQSSKLSFPIGVPNGGGPFNGQSRGMYDKNGSDFVVKSAQASSSNRKRGLDKASESAPCDGCQLDSTGSSSDGASGNVTGHPDYDDTHSSAAAAGTVGGQLRGCPSRQLFGARLESDSSSSTLAARSEGSKYDANHDVAYEAKTANMGLYGDDYVINGLRSHHEDRNLDIRRPLLTAEQQQQLIKRQMGVCCEPAAGNHNNADHSKPTNENSIMIGQQNFVSNGDSDHNNEANKPAPSDGGTGAEQMAAATPPGSVIKRKDVCDYYCLGGGAQQKFCDTSALKVTDTVGRSAGAPISGAKQRGSANKSSRQTVNSGQIYSNEFYYCKSATSGSPKAGHQSDGPKPARHRQSAETNHNG